MRSRRFLLNHAVARGLLALAFLFAQQTAALHWLSHAVEATQSKAGKAPTDHCDECLTLSALGAGAAVHALGVAACGAHHAQLASAEVAASPALVRLAFRSRAPPSLV